MDVFTPTTLQYLQDLFKYLITAEITL